jgi:hypothetical protein
MARNLFGKYVQINKIFWGYEPYQLIKNHQRFKDSVCLHHQGFWCHQKQMIHENRWFLTKLTRLISWEDVDSSRRESLRSQIYVLAVVVGLHSAVLNLELCLRWIIHTLLGWSVWSAAQDVFSVWVPDRCLFILFSFCSTSGVIYNTSVRQVVN